MPDQPTSAQAAAFWNGLNNECREALLAGYDGIHPWSLAAMLEESGMLFEAVPSPRDRVVAVAEEDEGGHPVKPSTEGVQLVLARELVRILDRGALEDVDPQV